MASRSDIELVLSTLDEFEDVRRVPEAKALWDVSVVVDGTSPVRLLVDNGINEIYVQGILRDPCLDANPALLLEVLQGYGTVGLASLQGDLCLRGSCFLEYSQVHAITNTLLSVVYAFNDYRGRLAA
ncbi:hypothetical protein [Ornithinimicrobium avium]|uniref:Uncharacterized protein n=1 Tax=Ornithinimicrobium avium TaxID=2283195 RepID=A0A345NKA9_9MICO|nr:hypothetical protein [Ornithinimicrobium avium]AXH95467.1 hypothetical protein DV701_04375 [Ornithinimicrobium avium]